MDAAGLAGLLSSAALVQTQPVATAPRHDPPIPLASEPTAALSGPSGATAQTGGFVGGLSTSDSTAGFTSGPSAGTAGFGGGLASSPNVPRPGTSIDPATGKPHVAGLTRAELEAKRALEAGPSGTVQNPTLSNLSGREQAARQLTGTVDDVVTPGKELPGGWGPAKQVPVPGSSPNAPSSVYEDIAEGLEKVGTAAFNLIPQGLKDALNPDHPVDKGKQPMGSPPKARRSSVGVFLDNVKQGTGAFLHDVQDTLQSDRRVSIGSIGSNRSAGNDSSVIAQVKNFFAESVQTVESQTSAKVASPVKTSLPSTEKAGALPGEHSTGVGALPGKISEAGVAVLPEEKKLDPDLPLGNQTSQPGTTSGVGDLPGKSTETGVAVLPDEKKAENDGLLNKDVPQHDAATSAEANDSSGAAALLGGLGATGAAAGAYGATHHSNSSTAVDSSNAELAPPLPATNLGQGAAHGATDLEQAGLPASNSTTAPVSAATTAPSSITSVPDASGVAPDTTAADSKHANDRTTSTASITAIRHGHEGNRSSPLAQDPISTTTTDSATATKDDTGLTQSLTSSLAPGNEVDGIGHPSTRSESTVRSPGSYPTPDHSSTGSTADHGESKPTTASAAPSGLATSTIKEEKSNGSPNTVANPNTAGSETAHKPATAAATADAEKGHRRTGSNVSTGSNGKKKVGFMHKLKGEIKVIGGKLSHDEKKVEEGLKIKHGEL